MYFVYISQKKEGFIVNKKEFLCHNALEALQIIHDLCIDYDGFNTVEGLKSLIDDIRTIAEENLNDIEGRNE